jgi:hypothetical protein
MADLLNCEQDHITFLLQIDSQGILVYESCVRHSFTDLARSYHTAQFQSSPSYQ